MLNTAAAASFSGTVGPTPLANVAVGATLLIVMAVVYLCPTPSLSMTSIPTVRVPGPSARNEAGTVAEDAVTAVA